MANRWWWNGVLRAVGYQGKPRQGNHFWLRFLLVTKQFMPERPTKLAPTLLHNQEYSGALRVRRVLGDRWSNIARFG